MSNDLFKSKNILEKRKSSIQTSEDDKNLQQAKKVIPDFE